MIGVHADPPSEVAHAPMTARLATAGPSFPPLAVLRSTLRASFERLLLWQERATQRRHLSRVEGHMLEDIGLTRADVALEVKKPFWRP